MQLKKYIIVGVTLLLTLQSFAQSDLKSESELKETANKLFEENKLVEAAPMFAQLLALYPKDVNYNFKYGACLLASDADKEKPLKYLKFATAKSTVDPRAYYYLGRAFHLNYEFAKAVKLYSKFKNKGSSEDKEKYAIERKIEMCKNGNNLLSRINEVQVLSKQEISAKDFFRVYDLKGIDGSIIIKPTDFMSKYDKKIEDKSIIYLPANANEVYYSSYGNKGTNGKDIFKSIKLGNGSWSEPVNLGPAINTEYDEDFAFIHPDGRTLYFASKGHSSMGGYDLFVSTFDNTINEWTTPVNLDFAFSSADDDILFITDEDKNIAFFASNRTNEQGEYTVYKVKVEKEAADVSVIKGSFIAENSPNLKKAKITVIDKETNKTIGVYETDSQGNYLVEINENGGSYQFNIETSDDSPIHTGIVNVPQQDEFEVLGQELRLVGTGDDQQLVIKNIFDGTAATAKTSSGPQVSTALLRKKANLDVNLSAEEILAIETSSDNNTIADNNNTPEPTVDNNTSDTNDSNTSSNNIEVADNLQSTSSNSNEDLINKEDLVARLDQLYDQLNKEKEAVEQVGNFSFQKAIELKNEANKEFEKLETQKASDALEEVTNATEQSAKEKALEAAYATQLANNIESNLDKIEEKENQLNVTKSLIETEELAIASKQLKRLESESVNPLDGKELIQNEKKSIEENIDLSNRKIASLNTKVESFTKEKETLDKQIQDLEAELAAEKGDKTVLENRLSGYKLDQSDMNYQIETVQNQLAKEQANSKSLEINKTQLEQLESNYATINSSDEVATISQEEKDELLGAVKSFRDNDQLAYSGSNIRTNNVNDQSGNNSGNNNETAIADNSRSNSSESPVANLSVNEIDAYYQNQIQEKDLIADKGQAIEEKLEAYESWNNDLNSKLQEQQALLSSTQGENEKATIQGEIDGILLRINSNKEAIASEQSNLATLNEGSDASLADNSDLNNSSNTESNINSSSNITGAETSASASNEVKPTVTLENIDVSSVDENSIIPENYTSIDLKQEYNYGSQDARRPLASAKQLFAEAATYGKKANDTRSSAYDLSTIDARNAAFEQAAEYEKASKEKQLEAVERYAAINAAEYQKNASLIGNSDNYGEDFQSSNLDIANLLADEAEVYFNNAQEIRSSISPTDRLSKKESSLQKAYDFEMLALTKQDEALKILKVVETEYETNPVSNFYTLEEKTIEPIEDNVISIEDATVMETSTVEDATFKADSLSALVSSLAVQKKQIKAQIENTRNEEERLGLEDQVEDINSLQEQAKKQADLYYLRAEQIEQDEKRENEIKEKALATVLNPASVEDIRSVAIDTVEISEEREKSIINSEAYVQYIENANKRERAVRSASLEYDRAVELATEKERLTKAAIILKNVAAKEENVVEKERLIKEASVIDQKVIALNKSVDSINNIIKIKNFLITSSDRAMQNSIASLSELEQTEIKKMASVNVSSDPLPAEELADLPISETTVSNEETLTSNESSISSSPLTTINPDDNNVEPEEVVDTTVEPPVTTNETNIADDSNEESIDTPVSNSVSEETVNDSKENTPENKEENQPVYNNTTSTINDNEPEKNQVVADVVDIKNIPRIVKQAIFVKMSPKESAYGVDKPIPVNPKMPEGLIYKVQVGAFRNPIPQDLFKGFAPLMAEPIPSGITRYTAGIFVKEKEAVLARNEIRNIGYPDAFVVAFLNGKRISLTEARKTDNSTAGMKDVVASNSNRSTTSSNSSTVPKSPSGSKAALPSSFNSSNVAQVVNSETIEGVYYTVQIGVYSKPVSAGEFSEYQPLNVKVLSNGLIRYHSGLFRNAVEANQLKERVAQKIKDAFVTAYYNGKRISLSEAARLSNRN